MVKLAVRIDYFAGLKQLETKGLLDWTEIVRTAARTGTQALAVRLDRENSFFGEKDIRQLKRTGHLPLQLLIDADSQSLAAAGKIKPQLVWIISGNSRDGTAKESLNLVKNQSQIAKAVAVLKKKKIKTFLFLDPDAQAIRLAKRLAVTGVALNAGTYYQTSTSARKQRVLEDLHVAGRLVRELDLELHIGQDLDCEALEEFIQIPEVSFIHAGSSLVARSLFIGLPAAIEEMLEIIHAGSPGDPLTTFKQAA